MSDEELIVPSGIPQFTGNVDTLVSDAKTMTSDAKLFRDSGASVHSTFQGLQACYKAPEAEKLFATTAPVAAKAGAFASDLEKVSGALSTYATEIRPLAKKLGDLKDEAIAFVASVEGDDHWRRDKKKVDHNNNLWRSVNATVAAFTDAERSCHDKIVALVGGDKLIADDGTHKPNMYGYKASDLDHAEQTPWGSMAEREYTGIAWLGHQIKSFVWDGFIVDGVWGTIKGLGTLVGTDGWDKAGQAWTGLAKLATGLAITASPLGAAYWMTPDDKLPSWLRDSRTAMKETGKALVAYDQWGKNPARAAGGVTFNVLTTVFTGGSGAAAKGGAVAKTVGALSKVAKVVDPMTYVGKAGKFAFVKVGDLMSGLKNLRVGSTVHLAEETFKLPGEGATLPKRPPNLPETAVPFLADGNKVVYLDKGSSRFFDAEGKELQAATKELSADERAAKAAAERQKQPQPQHSTVSEHEKVPVAAGVHAGGDATASATRGGEHIPGGGHGPGSGPAGHVPGGPGGHVPGGSAGHTPTGGIGGHTPGGAAQHIPGGGAGSHVPGGAAHDVGRGPSASHEVPGTGGGNGGHGSAHSGGGGHDIPGSGHGASPHPGHDAPSSGAGGGHNSGGHGGHGDSPSGPHEPAGPRHGDETPPRDGGGHGGDHDTHPGNAHEGDGAHAPGPHGTENAGHGGGNAAGGSGDSPKGVPLDPQPDWHGKSAGKMRHYRFPAESVEHLSPAEQVVALQEKAQHLADEALQEPLTQEQKAANAKKQVDPGNNKLEEGCAGSLLHDNVITAHTSMTKMHGQKLPDTHPVLKDLLDRIEADSKAKVIPPKGQGHGKCAEIALINDRIKMLEANGVEIRTLADAKRALEGAQVHTRKIGNFIDRETGEMLHPHGGYLPPCGTCTHILPELGIHPV